MVDQYKQARAWIHKKLRSGVSQSELMNCVGVFSNKKKSQVMNEKQLSSKQYDKRNSFLEKAYYLLVNERF